MRTEFCSYRLRLEDDHGLSAVILFVVGVLWPPLTP